MDTYEPYRKAEAEMSLRYLTAPAHVIACDVGPATVLVDYRTNRVQTLIGPAARWWANLATTGDLEAGPITLSWAEARPLIRALCTAGMLVPARHPRPWSPPVPGVPWRPSWGTQEVVVGRIELPPASPGAVVSGAAALIAVQLALKIGSTAASLARLLWLLRAAARITRTTATPARAEQAVNTVRRASRFMPWRAACLEESAAVVLMLAASRQRVTWCHGVAADPIRLHAWVETGHGQPVAEPTSTDQVTALLTIPERDGGETD